MSKKVRIATFSLKPILARNAPQGMAMADFVIASLEKTIAQVLPDSPDLIVLSECCDRPAGLNAQEVFEYYAERGDKVLDFMKKTARENNCYIAFPSARELPDGTRRNSVYMIDRAGEIIGIYDKNYVVYTETTRSNILPGEDIAIFDCDFGRVGALICFDLPFEEMRAKYKAAKPDLMLFCSNFGGGLMRNFFAFETESFLVASCGNNCTGEIISPLGESLGKTSNYYNYVVKEINLDYKICHLDFNWDKIRAAKEKYKENFILHDIGYVGVVMLSYEAEDRTITDILKEFDIKTAQEYYDYNRKHRAEYVGK